MIWAKSNVNCKIRFRLTDEGERLMNAWLEAVTLAFAQKRLPTLAQYIRKGDAEKIRQQTASDGSTVLQLSEFANIFGPSLGLPGFGLPIETTVEIETEGS